MKFCLFFMFIFCYLSASPISAQLYEGSTSPLDIYDFLCKQKPLIGALLNLDPDTQLSQLYPDVSAADPSRLRKCYNASVGSKSGEEFNIFKCTIFDTIKNYYKYYPESFESEKFCEKVINLFKTIYEIGYHAMDCFGNQTTYQLGLSPLSDLSDADFKLLLGEKGNDLEMAFSYMSKPIRGRNERQNEDEERYYRNITKSESKVNKKVAKLKKNATEKSNEISRFKRQNDHSIDPMCMPKNKTALPSELDWRQMDMVTPAKYQGKCGSCWAFASIATLESAHLIKGKAKDTDFNLSEEQLVSCAKSDGCNGGTAVDAFNFFLINRGVTDEKTMPYEYKKLKCQTKSKKRVAKIKDYCLRGIYVNVNGKPEKLTDEDIQHAIREFGPVYSTLEAGDPNLKNHKSGIYTNPKCPKETNHAVTIVGWTKAGSWIIKNSWGDKWADRGFFEIKRGENLCGINTYISYPIL